MTKDISHFPAPFVLVRGLFFPRKIQNCLFRINKTVFGNVRKTSKLQEFSLLVGLDERIGAVAVFPLDKKVIVL